EEFETKGKDRGKFFKLPFIRGLFNMYDSLTFGYKCLMRSAELSGLEEEEEKNKKNKKQKDPDKEKKVFEKVMMPIATVLAIIIGLGLFIYLPTLVFDWIAKASPSLSAVMAMEGTKPYWFYLVKAAISGAMRIIIFIGYVWATSLLKDIRRTYMYHGAEHKTIFCYEAGLPLTVENVRKQKRLHPRCGTSFLILTLLVGIVVGMFIHIDNRILYTLAKLATFPVVIGIGYELIKLAGRKNNLLTRIISAPGTWLQKITTREPDDGMIECAIKAMELAIPKEEGSDNW
ncbi:MAG: DUF1385 domain-containing protein, partial [Clostridia bacterium]|nr:DUF1385 domain-containing protein [Clostridia bacterium]